MQPLEQALYVTKPYLPPKEEYIGMLERIWESHCLTNNGPLHQQLEDSLKKYLKVAGVSLFTNGHLALEAALEVLNIQGEVITTPFTFASTTHAIVRRGLTPVFADIRPDNFTIDSEKIERLITERTSALLPVHVFGYPCDVLAIQKIAEKYSLKVIYDAAHAFGVTFKEKGIGDYGDLSMFSMHATKVFHTIEGGAVTYGDGSLKEQLEYLKNFGIIGPETVVGVGMNAKMNEFQAAMGLINLQHIDEQMTRRKYLTQCYREGLKDISGIGYLEDLEDTKHNYAYMPILVSEESGMTRDELHEALKAYNIYTRKYFYPLITSFQCYQGRYRTEHLIHAKRVANQVLTLPIYGELEVHLVDYIVEAIKEIIKKRRGKV
ncbi:MAG: DegT/DnrJ/EryC1/StrS family aminotransferase [Cellulosilyticaceae bacterium]